MKTELTEEEKRERRKQSLARAKAKYSKTEKGKQTSQKYCEKNKENLRNYGADWREKKKRRLELLELFYSSYKSEHTDFEHEL